MNEIKIQSLILKKQLFNEADEIITVFSKQKGKLRLLAKSVRLAKSKLQYSLQAGFLVNLQAQGRSNLQRISGAEVVETFLNIREHLYLTKPAFVALEFCLKATADAEPNEDLFFCLLNFFKFLNSIPTESEIDLGMAKFKMQFLSSLGLSISIPQGTTNAVWFSSSVGGFVSTQYFDAEPVSQNLVQLFLELSTKRNYIFAEIQTVQRTVLDLNALLSKFCQFHLERDLKSEKLF